MRRPSSTVVVSLRAVSSCDSEPSTRHRDWRCTRRPTPDRDVLVERMLRAEAHRHVAFEALQPVERWLPLPGLDQDLRLARAQ